MKVVLMLIFVMSYVVAMLRTIMATVSVGAALVNSVAIIVSASCMMILFFAG